MFLVSMFLVVPLVCDRSLIYRFCDSTCAFIRVHASNSNSAWLQKMIMKQFWCALTNETLGKLPRSQQMGGPGQEHLHRYQAKVSKTLSEGTRCGLTWLMKHKKTHTELLVRATLGKTDPFLIKSPTKAQYALETFHPLTETLWEIWYKILKYT